MSNPTTITSAPGVPYVDIERIVDAPVHDVFRAYTEPELVAQWLGPHGYEMEILEFDARDGGGYSYLHHGPDGDFAFRGVFHSVREDAGITQTFEYAGAPGHVSLEAVVFEARGDSTLIRGHATFQSVEDRDGMVAAGMADGVTDGFERMDALLASN